MPTFSINLYVPPGSEGLEGIERKKFLTPYFTNNSCPDFERFMEYCKTLYGDENLLWVAHFQEMEKNVKKPAKFLELFQQAWDEYFDPSAPKQINLAHPDFQAVDFT